MKSQADLILLNTACAHQLKEIRRKTIANGHMQLRYQCQSCGRAIGNAVSRKDIHVPVDQVPLWNAQAEDSLWQAYAVESNIRQSKWWGSYTEYLASDRWARKRQKVLDKAGGICEACGDRPAQEVHHLTYRNVGAEPLWDLRAVCKPCHDFIHGETGEDDS